MDSRRRAIMGIVKSGGGLPSEYQEVEYLESTGEQYIDSEVLTGNNLSIECVVINTFGLRFSGISYGGSLFGGRKSSSDSNFSFTTGAELDFIGNGTSFLSIPKNVNTKKIYLEYSNNAISYICDSYSYINSSLNVQITNQYNIYIFARNQENTVNDLGTYKLFTFSIYDNDVLVRNFIPCYCKADNKPGLYDTVNNVFYTNANTSASQDFIVGSDVN